MLISLKCPKRACWIFYCWAEFAAPEWKLCSFAPHHFAEIELHKSIPGTSGVVCAVLAIKMLTFPTKSAIKDGQRWFPVNRKTGEKHHYSRTQMKVRNPGANTQKNQKNPHLHAVAAKNKVLYCQCQRSVPKQAVGGFAIVSAAFRPALSTHAEPGFPRVLMRK